MKNSTVSSLFYIPNIIDYGRAMLLLISIRFERILFVLFYTASLALDYFDGKTARYFSQVSVLGAILDMVIDRVSTVVILMKTTRKGTIEDEKLSILYVFFDMLGHFLYFFYFQLSGSSHKEGNKGLILRIYYQPWVMKIVCTVAESGFILRYLRSQGVFIATGKFPALLWKIILVFIALKGVSNVFQTIEGIKLLSMLQ